MGNYPSTVDYKSMFIPTTTQLIALISGFTVMLVQGSLYVFGTMTPYIFTYLYYQGQTDLEISQLSIINTLAIIFTNIGMFFSNFKILTFPHRVVSLIGVIGLSLCTFILSFCHHFVFFVVFYGVLYGLFIGYGYLAPLRNCYDHLPDRKGLCSGTCMMGFGLGALIFNSVLTNIVNPDNQKPQNSLFPKQIGDNLPFALQILSVIYAGIGIVGVALAIPHKQSKQQQNPLLEADSEQSLASAQEQEVVKAPHFSLLAIKYAFKHKIHLLLALLSTVVTYGFFVAFHFKEYGSIFIKDDHYLSLLGSLGSVGNGVFRMVLGATMDLISFKTIMLANTIVFMASCATIVFSVQNQATYLITIVLTYGCYGSLYSIFPTQTVRILGKRIGPKMYYITFFGFSFGALMQYLFHTTLVKHYQQDGYKYCFIIFGCLLVIALILILTVDFSIHPSEQKQISTSVHDKETTIEKDTLTALPNNALD